VALITAESALHCYVSYSGDNLLILLCVDDRIFREVFENIEVFRGRFGAKMSPRLWKAVYRTNNKIDGQKPQKQKKQDRMIEIKYLHRLQEREKTGWNLPG
jgi:hypothetical protein